MAFSLTIHTSIPATGSNPNVVSGTPLDFFTGPGVLTVLGAAEVAGVVTHNLQVVTNNIPTTPIPNSALKLASTVGSIKVDEDLLLNQYAIPAGSRVIHQVNNSAASATLVDFMYLVA